MISNYQKTFLVFSNFLLAISAQSAIVKDMRRARFISSKQTTWGEIVRTGESEYMLDYPPEPFDAGLGESNRATLNSPPTVWEPPFALSKLKLLEALDAAGLEDAIFSAISADEKKLRRWDAAQELATDHPLVVEMVADAKSNLGITDDQVQALFAAARI